MAVPLQQPSLLLQLLLLVAAAGLLAAAAVARLMVGEEGMVDSTTPSPQGPSEGHWGEGLAAPGLSVLLCLLLLGTRRTLVARREGAAVLAKAT